MEAQTSQSSLKSHFVCSIVFCTAAITAGAAGARIHVDPLATGVQDGTSWSDAFHSIDQALAVANQLDDIWVAEGMYVPSVPLGLFGPERTKTFHLVGGVKMFGGFPTGGGDGTIAARDPNLFISILSGDVNGDDEPNFVNNAENVYHVVVTDAFTGSNTRLDGFTITGGNVNGSSVLIEDEGGAVSMRFGGLMRVRLHSSVRG